MFVCSARQSGIEDAVARQERSSGVVSAARVIVMRDDISRRPCDEVCQPAQARSPLCLKSICRGSFANARAAPHLRGPTNQHLTSMAAAGINAYHSCEWGISILHRKLIAHSRRKTLLIMSQFSRHHGFVAFWRSESDTSRFAIEAGFASRYNAWSGGFEYANKNNAFAPGSRNRWVRIRSGPIGRPTKSRS